MELEVSGLAVAGFGENRPKRLAQPTGCDELQLEPRAGAR